MCYGIFSIVKIQLKKRFSKKVIDTKTGVIYDSLKEASIKLNINYSTLKNNFRLDKRPPPLAWSGNMRKIKGVTTKPEMTKNTSTPR